MKGRRRWRKLVNTAMMGLCALFAVATASVLFFILGYLIWHGGRALSWDFLTHLPAPVGESGGGMANAIVGSGKLLLVAMGIAVPVGVLAGIYLAEFGGHTLSFTVRYTNDLLNGVPTIVTGIFAYSLVVLPLHHFSTLAGGVALGIIAIPIITPSTEQFLRAVPVPMREASLALGAGRWKMITGVVLPAAAPGIITGIMLALARVAGETAPLLFTAFNNLYWSHGWSQPTASLPVMIYNYAVGPYADWHRQAWAAGLVLLGLVLVINLGSRLALASRSRHRA